MAVRTTLTGLTILSSAELDHRFRTLRGIFIEDSSVGCKENFSPCCSAGVNVLPTTLHGTDLLPIHSSLSHTHTHTHTHTQIFARQRERTAPWLGSVLWWRKSVGTRAPATGGELGFNNRETGTNTIGLGSVGWVQYGDNSYHLLSIHHVPDSRPRTLHALSH